MTTLILFRIGLILKGLDAVLEVIGGVLLLMPVTLDQTIAYLSQHELYNSVRHPMTAHLQHAAAAALEKATLAGAIYLIIHGLAKVILILAVFKDKKWGYQGLIGVLSFFAVVELVRCFTHHSALAFVLAFFDGLIVYLIAKEYRIHFSSREAAEAA